MLLVFNTKVSVNQHEKLVIKHDVYVDDPNTHAVSYKYTFTHRLRTLNAIGSTHEKAHI